MAGAVSNGASPLTSVSDGASALAGWDGWGEAPSCCLGGRAAPCGERDADHYRKLLAAEGKPSRLDRKKGAR